MKYSFQKKGKEQMHKLLHVISEAHLWAPPMDPELSFPFPQSYHFLGAYCVQGMGQGAL